MKNTCKKRLVERGTFAVVTIGAAGVWGDGAAVYTGDVHLFLFLAEAYAHLGYADVHLCHCSND